MKNILLNILKKENENIINNAIIKLIPMVNPDGVVMGNSRCSLAGVDLNWWWSWPNSLIHPEIYFLKANISLASE